MFKRLAVLSWAVLLAGAQRIDVGFIRNSSEFDGAGCSLWLPSDRSQSDDRHIFVSDFRNTATMNINGRDVHLVQVQGAEWKAESKKGDRLRFSYRGDGVEAAVDYVIAAVCAPDDESCEVLRVNATITVTRGSSKRVVAAQGLCGS